MRRKTAHRICQFCKKDFLALKTEVDRGKAKYCSISCGVSVKNKLNTLSLHEIFFRNISKEIHPLGCWIYLKTNGKGYGKLQDENRKQLLAHRYSYEIHKGFIPIGLFICHKCDNPSCVNPDHLFLGTAKDNHSDMLNKNRGNFPKGSKHHRTIFTEKQVAKIKKLLNKGFSITKLAKKYNVSYCLLAQIKYRRSWLHVEPEK